MYNASIIEEIVTPESAEEGEFESSEEVDSLKTDDLNEVYSLLCKYYVNQEAHYGGNKASYCTTDPDINYRTGAETNHTAFVEGMSKDEEKLLTNALKRGMREDQFEEELAELSNKKASKLSSEIRKVAKEIQSAEVPSFVEFVKEYVVEDYPYGSYRTKATFTVEGNPGKQRVVRTTIDPKTGRANAPKKTTYATKALIGLASDGRTYPISCSIGYGFPMFIIMYGDMQFQAASVHAGQPGYDDLLEVFGYGAWNHKIKDYMSNKEKN